MSGRRRSSSRTRGNNVQTDTSGDWMNTYADVVTLLLTFFIMLFSISTIDNKKFMELAASFRNAFMNQSTGGEIMEADKRREIINLYEDYDSIENVVSLVNEERMSLNEIDILEVDSLKKSLETAISELGLNDKVKIIEKEKFLILRFDSVVLFDLGRADIRASAKEILKKLGLIFNDLNTEIVIQGHTDDLPINTTEFPSNWELSTRRATNVVRFFIEKCRLDSSRLTATGNSEFKPIKPNDSAENRQENRRIDIVVSK